MTSFANILHNSNITVKKELDEIFRGEREIGIEIPYSRIDIEDDLSPDDFRNLCVRYGTPVILRGAAKNWPAVNKWHFDFFAEQYEKLEIVANLYDVKYKKNVTFKQFVDTAKNNITGNPIYLQEWWFQTVCPELMGDILIPEHFLDDENKRLLGFYNTSMWMGQKEAYTPIHQDSTHTNLWTAQITGKKEWIIINPSASLYLGSNGEPDYEHFFRNNNGNIMRGILNEGDILYLPHKWWHRAKTLKDAISLNTFYITPDIVSKYLTEILAIPLAVSLNSDLLKEYDPMRYNICAERLKILTKLLKLDEENILGIDTSGDAIAGIYAKAVA